MDQAIGSMVLLNKVAVVAADEVNVGEARQSFRCLTVYVAFVGGVAISLKGVHTGYCVEKGRQGYSREAVLNAELKTAICVDVESLNEIGENILDSLPGRYDFQGTRRRLATLGNER